MKVVQCPHCKKPVPWTQESIYRPFCSERCRIIDLGNWASGSYALPATEVDPNPEDNPEASEDPSTNDNSGDKLGG